LIAVTCLPGYWQTTVLTKESRMLMNLNLLNFSAY
jgi:hypothetical protein